MLTSHVVDDEQVVHRSEQTVIVKDEITSETTSKTIAPRLQSVDLSSWQSHPNNNSVMKDPRRSASLTDMDSDADSFHTADDEETNDRFTDFPESSGAQPLSTVELGDN